MKQRTKFTFGASQKVSGYKGNKGKFLLLHFPITVKYVNECVLYVIYLLRRSKIMKNSLFNLYFRVLHRLNWT